LCQIGGILQRRSESYRNKLNVFGTILALRHDPWSMESVKALNLIDAVFADNPAVREAWTRFFAAINDQSLNALPGFSIREERRRDLLLEMVKALGLKDKISSAELLRAYVPTFAVENTHLGMLERMHRRALYEAELRARGITPPPWPIAEASTTVPAAVMTATAQPAPQGGNGSSN
jgi:hypothetical protein